MPQAWPLTGRSEEIRLVDRLVRRTGDAPGVVLAGAAGVGKTRLAREALQRAVAHGSTVRWASATASARALPLGAFAAVVAPVSTDPTRLVGTAVDALLAGPGGRVTVGIDDCHLLDDLSALVVQQLVATRAATVIVTIRTGEPAPDAVTALWKDGHLPRMELRPLSAEETHELLEAALGAPVDGQTAQRLWTVTAGNVLYLRQLVDGERDGGRLREVAGIWRWTGRPRLSPGLAELVRHRIGALSAAERDVVEVLAFGEPLGVPLLARLTGADAVERAEVRGLVEVTAEGRRLSARLAHPLYGEVQRQECGLLRARRWRGRIAQALEDAGGRRAGDTLRRAVLAVDSDLVPDPELLSAGADAAVGLLDFELAIQLARAAADAGGGFGCHLALGYALTWSGRGQAAEDELARLVPLGADEGQRVLATLPRVGNLFWTLARPVEGQQVLAEALATASDGAARLDLVAMGSVLDAWLARPREAAAAARAVLADPRRSVGAETFACWGLVTACGGLGTLDGLADAVDRAVAASDSFGAVQLRTGIGTMWLRARRMAGLLDDSAVSALPLPGAAPDARGPAHFLTVALPGELALHRGEVRTAARWLRQGIAGARGADPGGWGYHLPLMLTTALGMAGDAAPARECLVMTEAARHPSFVFLDPDLLLARAWVAAAEGALTEAVRLAVEAADLAAAQHQPAVEVTAWHTAVQFGSVRHGDRSMAARLAELAGRVDGPRAPAAAAHAAALAAADGAGLLAASAACEAMGGLLLAADAAAQAASVFAGQQRTGSSQSATARAHALAVRCESASTPALAALAHPLPLTGREREVVALAATGLSNREIAERLVVSVRTVEGHLYRACAKLGVTDRRHLPTATRGRA